MVLVLITAGSDPPCKQNAPYYTRAMLIAELGVGNSPIFEEKKKNLRRQTHLLKRALLCTSRHRTNLL